MRDCWRDRQPRDAAGAFRATCCCAVFVRCWLVRVEQGTLPPLRGIGASYAGRSRASLHTLDCRIASLIRCSADVAVLSATERALAKRGLGSACQPYRSYLCWRHERAPIQRRHAQVNLSPPCATASDALASVRGSLPAVFPVGLASREHSPDRRAGLCGALYWRANVNKFPRVARA